MNFNKSFSFRPRNQFFLLTVVSMMTLASPGCSETPVDTVASTKPVEMWGDFPDKRPSCVKGIHLTSWIVGNKKGRDRFEDLLATTELNTVVIDVKESEGEVYIPGVKLDGKENYTAAMPKIKEYVKELKERGVFTIARIVVFHDNLIAKRKPEWSIRSSTPIPKAKEKGYREDIWVDRKGSAWADPFNKHVWDYNINVAERAIELGFQGIQFDYIRFPSDGPTRQCVYSKPHSSKAAIEALSQFLERAHAKFKPLGIELSIDVFGLVGSTGDDMGIGQNLRALIKHVDVVSPMMYPSHYAKGEFGIKDPNNSPYETLHRSVQDTLKITKGTGVEVRPFLQDFSLGVKYTAKMVRQQIQACNDLGIDEWLLWNPACRYTKSALKEQDKQHKEWVEPKPETAPEAKSN